MKPINKHLLRLLKDDDFSDAQSYDYCSWTVAESVESLGDFLFDLAWDRYHQLKAIDGDEIENYIKYRERMEEYKNKQSKESASE